MPYTRRRTTTWARANSSRTPSAGIRRAAGQAKAAQARASRPTPRSLTTLYDSHRMYMASSTPNTSGLTHISPQSPCLALPELLGSSTSPVPLPKALLNLTESEIACLLKLSKSMQSSDTAQQVQSQSPSESHSKCGSSL